MKKEELILFPAIGRGAAAAIAAMRAGHDDHEGEIAEIRRLTGGLAPPSGACRSWTALYEGLAGFIGDLDEHIRLGNEVLFPRVDSAA